uniref:Uncharacterized protein n=1 Tax=Arundo donax TaxID=35708 RepID=A0A0A8Z3S6_ARUDO
MMFWNTTHRCIRYTDAFTIIKVCSS